MDRVAGGANLEGQTVAGPVRDLVGEWTQQDYVSAGKWLSAFPDGPAKSAAVEAYAEAVAEYEPHVAAQWAMTLPPGRARDSPCGVYQNWPEAIAKGPPPSRVSTVWSEWRADGGSGFLGG